MIVQALAFYLFSAVLLLSGMMVITARNPVHSVLFLIMAFFNAAGLFLMLGAEFAALILVIVYVGAVAVLFLFVVMMLDINFADLRRGAMQYVPLGLMLGALLMAELALLYRGWQLPEGFSPAVPFDPAGEAENTRALGAVLYTDYIFGFQVAGLILLVAMIGAIVLTHRVRPGVRRQSIARQNATRAQDAMELRKVKSGQGI